MAIQKIERYGQFRPSPINESRVRRMEQLAGFAGGIAQTARAFGEAIAAEEAPEKARKAVEEAVETGQELPVGRGYGADAFNREAVSAYLSTIDLDVKNKLNDLAETNKDNPQNFVNDANGYLDGLTKSVPKEYKEQIFRNVQLRIKEKTANVSDNFLKNAKLTNQTAIANSVSRGKIDIGNLARSGSEELQREKEILFTTMDALAESNPEYAVKLAEEKRSIERNILLQENLGKINRVIFNENLSLQERETKATEFIEKVVNTNLKEFSPEEKDILVNTLFARLDGLRKNIADQEKTLASEQQQQLALLDVAIDQGSLSAEELETEVYNLVNAGVIKTASELSSRLIKIRNKTTQEIEKSQSILRVSNSLRDGMPVGELPVTETEVNTYYDEQLFPALANSSPIERSAIQTEFVKKTYVVPKSLKRELTADLVSQDSERIANAVDTMDRLLELPGIGQNIFSDDQMAFATEVQFLTPYLGSEAAIRQAQANTDPKNIDRVNAAKQAIKDDDENFKDSYQEEILDAYGNFRDYKFGENELTKAEIINDYGELVESFYVSGMRLDSAKEKAIKIIQSNFKSSEFGLMKFPPQDYYGIGPNQSTEYIRDNIYNQIMGSGGLFGIELKKENIILRSDDQTAREVSLGKPTYAVLIRLEDGSLQRVIFDAQDENGNLIKMDRYRVDQATEKQKEAARIKAEQELRLQERADAASIAQTAQLLAL